MSALIQFRQVSKWFKSPAGRFEAIRNLSLDISAGEYLGIVGKSGSGKSTLLNMLTGIDHPSQGSVWIGGTEVHALGEDRLALWRGRTVGIVFQFFQLVPTLTISENLLLAMDFVDAIPRNDRAARVDALLRQVGISAHADKLPASLSGGEQQRAAIARALANDPPLVVADEPTGNLDTKTTEAVQRLFLELADSGKTVIVVTHEDVSGSDYGRILTLKDGEIAGDRQNPPARHAVSVPVDRESQP